MDCGKRKVRHREGSSLYIEKFPLNLDLYRRLALAFLPFYEQEGSEKLKKRSTKGFLHWDKGRASQPKMPSGELFAFENLLTQS